MTPAMETALAKARTLADLLSDLGNVPLDRVLAHPPLGTATEADVIRLGDAANKRLCELVDGVLVEKAMGAIDSALMMILGRILGQFVHQHKLGFLLGEQGMTRLFPDQVRIPDISFFARERLPCGKIPDQPIMDFAPDLAVEILSPSNTKGEMARKRRDYFAAGARLVWEIDPRARSAVIWTDAEHGATLTENDSLDGGAVLPGFTVNLGDLLAELDGPTSD